MNPWFLYGVLHSAGMTLLACDYSAVENRCSPVNLVDEEELLNIPRTDGDQRLRGNSCMVEANAHEVLTVFTSATNADSSTNELRLALTGQDGALRATCGSVEGAASLERGATDLDLVGSASLGRYPGAELVGIVYGAHSNPNTLFDRILFRAVDLNGCPFSQEEPLIVATAHDGNALGEPCMLALPDNLFLVAWTVSSGSLDGERVAPVQLNLVDDPGGQFNLILNAPIGLEHNGIVSEVALAGVAAAHRTLVLYREISDQGDLARIRAATLDDRFEVESEILVHEWTMEDAKDPIGLAAVADGRVVRVAWVAREKGESRAAIVTREVALGSDLELPGEPVVLSTTTSASGYVSVTSLGSGNFLVAWASREDAEHSARGQAEWAIVNATDGPGVLRDMDAGECRRSSSRAPLEGAGRVPIGAFSVLKVNNDVQAVYEKRAKDFGSDRIGYSVWGFRISADALGPD